MHSKPVFHLFIPCLLKPLSAWSRDFLFEPQSPNLRNLLLTLEVTNTQKVQGLDACFLSTFSQQVGELPIAHYRYKAQHSSIFDSGIVCADPVHLEVGMNDVTLTEQISDLSDDDALELIEILNQHFKQDGLEFIFGSNQHWYASFPADELVHTTPLDQALKKNIAGLLPVSSHRNWQQIQNEVQMLLHSAEVNQNRERAGLTPVNSLWFWGGGQPHKSEQLKQNTEKLFSSNETQGKTFAVAAGCNWSALPQTGKQLLEYASGLNYVILDQLFLPAIHDNLEDYQRELSVIDENFIMPLLHAWQQNKIDIIIDDCDGISIKPLKVPTWKFWVKPKSIVQIAKENQVNI